MNQIEFGKKMVMLEKTLKDIFCIDFQLFIKKYLPWSIADVKRFQQFANAKNETESKLYVLFPFL